MSFGKRLLIGQTTLGPQVAFYQIAGESLAKGDTSDRLTNPGSEVDVYSNGASTNISWGWNANLGLHRQEPGAFIPLRDIVPAFSRIFAAILHVRLDTRGTFSSGIVPGGSIRFNFYGVRRPGWNRLNYDFHYYDAAASAAWAEYGAQVGTDLTSAIVGFFDFTQTDYDAMAGGTLVVYKTMDLKTEAQYRSDRNEDVGMIGLLGNPSTNPGTQAFITVRSPAVNSLELNRPHSYLEILYVPPIVLHGAQTTAGRAIDLAKVLDKDSLESQFHLYMGFIDAGEVGDPQKYWIRNTRTDRIARRMIIEATRSFATAPVAKSTNVGTKTLRSVDVYQLHLDNTPAVDQLTPRGAWYIIATSTTQYSVYFQANFTGAYVLMQAANLFASDVDVIDTAPTPDRKLLSIRAAKWAAAAPTTNDRWDFDTIADTTDPNFLTDSKAMMVLIPPTVAGGDVADTAKARAFAAGPSQRLRGSTYDFNDSGTTRSVVMVADTQQAGYAVGQYLTIFDGTGFEEIQIHAIKLTADALPTGAPAGEVGDALVTEAQLSRSYATGAYVTGGLYIDQLDKSNDVLVATGGASAGQALINTQSNVDWIAGDTFTAIALSGANAGQSQKYIVQAVNLGGSQVQSTTNLTFALAEGDILIKTVTNNQRSFFVRGTVPEGAPLGDRLAIVRAYEARASLQNII